MVGQLLPPPDLAPPDLGDATPDRCIAVWLDMLDAGYKLVTAGLAREVGPDGDVDAAYRRWYSEQMEEHDRVVARMLLRMQQRHSTDAR